MYLRLPWRSAASFTVVIRPRVIGPRPSSCSSMGIGSISRTRPLIETKRRAPRDLQSSSTKCVAVGAGFLNGSTVFPGLKDANGNQMTEEQRRNYFSKYRALRPEKVFGNSIYLYRNPNGFDK